MPIIDTIDADAEGDKKFYLFGRELSKVPCFRNSFLNGTLSGLAVGFGHFMLTSRVKRSTDLAVVSFGAVTLSSWFYCRYQWSKQKFESERLKKYIDEWNTIEGTEGTPSSLTEL